MDNKEPERYSQEDALFIRDMLSEMSNDLNDVYKYLFDVNNHNGKELIQSLPEVLECVRLCQNTIEQSYHWVDNDLFESSNIDFMFKNKGD